MRTEPIDKWVRGYVGETAVVDTRAPLLFWDEYPFPFYAFPRADVRVDLLTPGAKPGSYDLTVGDRTIPNAAWTRDEPELADHLVVSWRRDGLDRWTEEDEEVFGHPRDPHARVETIASSRHVQVSLDGVPLADSHDPVLLFETGLPTRYYLPRADVDFDLLRPVVNRTHCPYKGDADSYWSVGDAENVAWSFSAPYRAVGNVRDRICFYNESVDITLDGVPQERPVTHFR